MNRISPKKSFKIPCITVSTYVSIISVPYPFLSNSRSTNSGTSRPKTGQVSRPVGLWKTLCIAQPRLGQLRPIHLAPSTGNVLCFFFLFHPFSSVLDLFSSFFRDLQQMFLVILSGPFNGLLAWSNGLTPHLKTVDPSPPPAPQLVLLPNLAILHLPPPGQGDARKGATWCHPQRQTWRSEWMSQWFEIFKRCGFFFQM